MKQFPVVICVLVAGLLLSCSDNPVEEGSSTPPDPAKADQLATIGFQALGDTLQALSNRSNDDLRDVRFDGIRDQLESALQYENKNGIAHLGLAIVEILELNYSSDIWEVVDSLEAWGGRVSDLIPPFGVVPSDRGHMLIGRQFELMATLPMAFSMGMATTFPSNVSLARIQSITTDTIRPALTRAISHLNTVETQTDTGLRIRVKSNGVDEYVVVDLGEILVFSASVRALRAAFGVFTAYDVDLWGPDDTYNWLDDARAIHRSYCEWASEVTVTDVGGGMVDIDEFLDHYYYKSLLDSMWYDVGHYNLEDRPAFLALRDGGASLTNARNDYIGVVDHLENAANFIRNRTNETEENVIKLADLTDLEGGLGDPQGPNFAKNWTRVEDVIDFTRSLLTGPVAFSEELGPSHTTFSWTMNLSALFTSPVPDWNILLPYHRWNLPSGAWFTYVDSVRSWSPGGLDYWASVRTGRYSCTYASWQSVNHISMRTRYRTLDASSFLEFLDAPNGNPINVKAARFPYFADYTFHGLFPDMNRAKWVELMNILDPQFSYVTQTRGAPR